jgi:hypothetical protein
MTTGQGVASQRKYFGRWALGAGGRELTLRFDDGDASTLAVQRLEPNVLKLDARKFLVERSGVCR